MPEIKLLSEDIINKIAAGEVIERPASVAKELLENSLDAGATSIIIEIKNYGQGLIKVSDNGSGMSREDVHNSILRHATSKISAAEDLFSVRTLGFRGEALASIAAVSRLAITTKTSGQLESYKLLLVGGVVKESGIAASGPGTIVEVNDLFFNTPARKKFLRTNAVELRQIVVVVSSYALLYPGVSFKLIHDQREILNCPATDELRNRLASVYGVSTAKEMIEVRHNSPSIEILGMAIKPYFARNDKSWQTLLVNGRWIKNEEIAAAVYEAYHSVLFVNKHPVFVLRLQLDPASIDVNVHPTKSDIKIEQKELVCSTVTRAVREALARHNLLPEIGLETQEFVIGPWDKIAFPARAKYSFEQSQQTILKNAVRGEAETAAISQASASLNHSVNLNGCLEAVARPESHYLPELANHSTLPPLKVLGQIHKTFFAAETVGGMFFIDQHGAHERVLYEQLMEQYDLQKVQTQQLLQPEILDVSAQETEVLQENTAFLERLGFSISRFGDHSFAIKSVPEILGRLQAKEIIAGIVEFSGKKKLESVKEELITRMACRSAVMAGNELSILEMENILKLLSAKKLPFTCPHGRPTMIRVSVQELEKKFRRKV